MPGRDDARVRRGRERRPGRAGFYTNPANGTTDGFFKKGGQFTDLAGFWADGTTGFIHGFPATPVTHKVALNVSLSPMSQGTATIDNGVVSVTVNASGLNPGTHAAHIHIGSCQSQGPVKYMLMDFTADGHGNISNQTRTVTGVSAVMLTGGWYLNGQPTIYFRPLLCANL
jgi:hypothetical protein